MTPDTSKKLKGLIGEYGNSLTRIQAEKELMKLIEQRALVELGQDQKAFRVVATAFWKDEVRVKRNEVEWQLALFDLARGADDAETAPDREGRVYEFKGATA